MYKIASFDWIKQEKTQMIDMKLILLCLCILIFNCFANSVIGNHTMCHWNNVKGSCCSDGTYDGTNRGICCPLTNGICCGDGTCCPANSTCSILNETKVCLFSNTVSTNDQSIQLKHVQSKSPIRLSYKIVPTNNEYGNEVRKYCFNEWNKIYCELFLVYRAQYLCASKLNNYSFQCLKDPSLCFTIVNSTDSCYEDPRQCNNPVPKTCSWYLGCLQKKFNCPKCTDKSCNVASYPTVYADKYCEKFRSFESKFSEKGKEWMYNVMNCLQQSLVSVYQRQNITCQEIGEAAFKSHPLCYVKAGICSLPISDWKVIWEILELKDFNSWLAFKQVIDTGTECSKYYANLFVMRQTLTITKWVEMFYKYKNLQ